MTNEKRVCVSHWLKQWTSLLWKVLGVWRKDFQGWSLVYFCFFPVCGQTASNVLLRYFRRNSGKQWQLIFISNCFEFNQPVSIYWRFHCVQIVSTVQCHHTEIGIWEKIHAEPRDLSLTTYAVSDNSPLLKDSATSSVHKQGCLLPCLPRQVPVSSKWDEFTKALRKLQFASQTQWSII